MKAKIEWQKRKIREFFQRPVAKSPNLRFTLKPEATKAGYARILSTTSKTHLDCHIRLSPRSWALSVPRREANVYGAEAGRKFSRYTVYIEQATTFDEARRPTSARILAICSASARASSDRWLYVSHLPSNEGVSHLWPGQNRSWTPSCTLFTVMTMISSRYSCTPHPKASLTVCCHTILSWI